MHESRLEGRNGGALRKFLKIGGIALGVVLLLVVIVAGLVYATMRHFYPSPPQANYSRPKDPLEAQRQDLDYFAKLIGMDRSYSTEARAEAQHRLTELADSNTVIPRPNFRVALMKIAALADNGHTRLDSDSGADPMELPVRVAAFSDGIYILHATKAYADLLGGKIVSIDGHRIDEVMARLEQLRGGTPQWRKEYAQVYISWQDVLVGAGIAPDMGHSTWTVTSPSGTTVTRTLTPYKPSEDEPDIFVNRIYSAEPLKELGADWVAYQPERPSPITFSDFDATFRRVRLPHSCVMLIQFRSNDDEGNNYIKNFEAATRADMQGNKPCQLIFDNRFNAGGNLTKTIFFARDLPHLISASGHIYLLTSGMTFSAGITTTALIKHSGGDRVIILGEPVGDRLAFFAEGRRGCLPNYPLCLHYETGKHDYGHSCTNLDTCFWLNWLLPLRVKTLQPDEIITMTFDDWRQGRDPVFERATVLANRNEP
ncbi:MAG: hypothetical protein WBW46_19805 [Candidatus Sulfotelmatobacter sp.]